MERLFRRFTVAPGESPTEYEGLVQAVIADLQPNDTIETILAKDVADHTWEVQRLRRIETALLTGEAEPLEQEHRSPEVTAIIEETIARLRAPKEVDGSAASQRAGAGTPRTRVCRPIPGKV